MHRMITDLSFVVMSNDSSATATLAEGPSADWPYRKHLESIQSAASGRQLALSWDHLSIRGVGSVDNIVYAPDLGTLFTPWRQFSNRRQPAKRNAITPSNEHGPSRDSMSWVHGTPRPGKGQDGLRPGERYILKDFSGIVKPGEMMLVIGRPGSGCTTFLKTLAGQTDAYAGVEGAVRFGTLSAKDKAFDDCRSEVVYVSEEDVHDPNLTVGRTLDFATRMETIADSARTRSGDTIISAKEYQIGIKMNLLQAFGVEHTHDTKVGNQYIRGVSGGERKRVTLVEALTTDASIYCWDNSTRGLDANTALGYIKACRTLSDVANKVNVVSLYQAGNGIYDQFDKVTVIAEGRVIYYGPRSEARGYFENLGLEHMDGANTADYLTAATALQERCIVPGFKGSVPRTAAEFAQAYEQSEVAQRMRKEIDHYNQGDSTERTLEAVRSRKSKWVSSQSPQKAPYLVQIQIALIREYQQRWGDQWSFWFRQASTFILAWITGSVFYQLETSTTGIFLRGGVIFSTLVYPIIMAFSEVQLAFDGRQIMSKHRAYNMYSPSAVFLAQTIADVPILAVQLLFMTVILYFMAGLKDDAGLYFTYYLFTFILAATMTALFRAIGYANNVYNNATKISGGLFTAFVIYSGFIIYQPSMHPWLSWIRWLNPMFYALEALMVNELDGLDFECAPPQLAPYGADYVDGPSTCAITGAQPGSAFVTGAVYLDRALNFSKPHVWRNFGIIIAWWVAYTVVGCLFIEKLPADGSTRDITLFRRGDWSTRRDDSNQLEKTASQDASSGTETLKKAGQIFNNTFVWRDITYTVKAGGHDIQLLDGVSGYCKAGTLTALMGASGAGKTTLMDVLAARKTEGDITGDISLNGKPISISFQRTTGYCEQLDVHLPTSTVREALEFSALLRQPRGLSQQEKLAYVDVIIDLLELRDLEHAIVGVPGAGLGVEQRKRLTIGVELVTRPTLLFLDEPTSGLDGQSSFMILQFLRKLAASGQSIMCTIHQPSAALFANFDQLLLLKRGGKTVYFGAVDALPSYFASQGTQFPPEVNPAEYMIDVVSGDLSRGQDWSRAWKESAQRKQRIAELEEIEKQSTQGVHEDDQGYEYAATFATQVHLVTQRASVQLWRDTEYVTNKFMLHIFTGLLVGFSFWKIGNSYADLQNRLFAIFNFIFVAPGVMVQTQPKFIANRDVFEKREKKAKTYSWVVFCIGEIVAELPYLLICAFLFWACWYPTAGLRLAADAAGPVFLMMVLYELLYTGIAQFIASYAPNAPFAALTIPVLIATLINFSGTLIPYSQITSFWRYWLYYLDPFRYLLGGLLSFAIWNVDVKCSDEEFGKFDPPSGQTCGQYMEGFLSQATGYLDNPDATSQCGYCGYSNGSQYLRDLNITKRSDGWRDFAITLLFVISSYALVFVLLKLRSKRSKTAHK